MTERITRAGRGILVASIAALFGSLLGVGLTPGRATAAVPLEDGWTCYQYDVCMPGSAPCCFEIASIPPGQGRCSTMCGEE